MTKPLKILGSLKLGGWTLRVSYYWYWRFGIGAAQPCGKISLTGEAIFIYVKFQSGSTSDTRLFTFDKEGRVGNWAFPLSNLQLPPAICWWNSMSGENNGPPCWSFSDTDLVFSVCVSVYRQVAFLLLWEGYANGNTQEPKGIVVTSAVGQLITVPCEFFFSCPSFLFCLFFFPPLSPPIYRNFASSFLNQRVPLCHTVPMLFFISCVDVFLTWRLAPTNYPST